MRLNITTMDLNFENLIDKDKYQVFLFTCPITIPLNFLVHSWFVVNQKGAISRWEVIHVKNLCPTSWGYLHKDLFPLASGIRKFMPIKNLYSKNKLIASIEGGEGSNAQQMAEFIVNSNKTYPHCNFYNPLGPNSNSYTQWILDQFPQFPAKLKWNALGKNYKFNRS